MAFVPQPFLWFCSAIGPSLSPKEPEGGPTLSAPAAEQSQLTGRDEPG